MDNINPQAKNEVRELLNDLVVSPVSRDLEKQLENVSYELSVLKETLNKLSILQGLIERKSDNVSKNINNTIKEEVSNYIDCCETNIINKIKSKVNDLNNRIDDDVKKFSDDINAFKSSCENIRQQIEKSEQNSVQIQNMLQNIDKGFPTLSDSLKKMSDSFMDKTQETSEYHLRQYKQNKVSFLLLIVLSFINMFGLIGVILCTLYTN